MLKKQYRLKEREVKRVLHKGKPFFSYGVVLNTIKNKKNYSRFAIVIGGKSVPNNVVRNYFRRKFYHYIEKQQEVPVGYDLVFVVKKNNKVDKKDESSIMSFEKDLSFLLKKFCSLSTNKQ